MTRDTITLAAADPIFYRSLFFDAVLCGVMIMQFSHWVSFSKNERVFARVIVVRLLFLLSLFSPPRPTNDALGSLRRSPPAYSTSARNFGVDSPRSHPPSYPSPPLGMPSRSACTTLVSLCHMLTPICCQHRAELHVVYGFGVFANFLSTEWNGWFLLFDALVAVLVQVSWELRDEIPAVVGPLESRERNCNALTSLSDLLRREGLPPHQQ
jgi:hypothetical protein